MLMRSLFRFVAFVVIFLPRVALTEEAVRLASFDVDATPPLGAPMAYQPVMRLDELTLRCRGIVLIGSGEPIVLCAVDWIGIANEGHDAFREALAVAAGTIPERVAVHTLHQHDAPGCDFTAERLIREIGVRGYTRFEGEFHRLVIRRAADAVRAAIERSQPITHYSFGEGRVHEVASQRRIAGPDGRIRATRTSSTKDPAIRAEPEGVIDPIVSLLSFWNGDRPVAMLSYYACHPQSYYRRGIPSPDFPGIARFIRGQDRNNSFHLHFNGAGGNVTAGKYNDGAEPNRMILAQRLVVGIREAESRSKKAPLAASQIGWKVEPVGLPIASHLNEPTLIDQLRASESTGTIARADQLAFFRRAAAGHAIDVSCLQVGTARVLHMPGELFVEYQLAAKGMRPDLQVMMAAYGDYGPGYIGTQRAYAEGGYETQPTSSNVSPDAESVLIDAIKKLLTDAVP